MGSYHGMADNMPAFKTKVDQTFLDGRDRSNERTV